MKTETIAAIATSLSESGISIIRISGDQAISVANRIFFSQSGKKVSDFKSHTIHYGFIQDEEKVVDEVILSVMKAPKSYTTEDTVEINCHGGVLMTKKILGIVLKNGARLAMPGEFTKRAFLNGRIDLSKAEAIMDIIQADNEFALQIGMNQLKGSVSNKVIELREKILYEIAFIESALDDPEHISLDGYPSLLEQKVDSLLKELIYIEETADNGKILKEGINTVIVGKPNAGKSSLLNLLVGEEKAIVTDIAGTTRDVLEENIKIGSIRFNIVDTAGIRYTKDEVERIGVNKAKEFAKNADLILYIVDSSVLPDENDEEIIKLTAGKKILILFNKSDLDPVIEIDTIKEKMIQNHHNKEDIRFIRISAKNNIGIDELEKTVTEMFFHGELELKDEVMITNLRQKEAIVETINSLKLVKKSILDEMPEDFLTIDLMNAYEELGKIIGEELGEDLVNEIFSKFCMGK